MIPFPRLHIPALISLAAAIGPVLADPVPWGMVGEWDISYYPASQGCQAFALIGDETAFFIGYDNTGAVRRLDLTLLDPRWQSLRRDLTYPVTVVLGRAEPWQLDMAGVRMQGDTGLSLRIDAAAPAAQQFVADFRRESRMTWSYGDTEFARFSLRGSRRALDAVAACERSHSTAAGALAAERPAPGASRNGKAP